MHKNRKLESYVCYKIDYNVETYITCVDIDKFRRALANFRSSSHSLMIEKGRHYGLDRDVRFCPYCECILEDEFHFLLVCPLYNELRSMYIPYMYYNYPTVEKFHSLMSSNNSTVIRNLASYICYAFGERNKFLSVFD